MTKKILKKNWFCFFVVFFVCLIGFLCLPANKVSALEVDYPVIKIGAIESSVTDQSDLAQYLKYVFDIGIFIGFFAVFLSLIWAGVLYFLSPVVPNALANAKDRISGAISGLLILVLLYLIITTINPALAIFKIGKLSSPPPPPEPAQTQPAGVNFYTSNDCSENANNYIANVQDFGTSLTNKINSAMVVSDPEKSLYYLSVLYDESNYWGKCQYIVSAQKCLKVNFGASASIYPFDFEPNGNGVYFYRKSFNNAKGKEDNLNGGFLKITNSEIKNKAKDGYFYVGKLDKLTFTGNSSNYNNPNDCTVPKEEQDCVQWDNKGKCLNYKCPTLAEKNISSIKINGDYIILLVYFAPSDNNNGPWTYCQAFPGINDVNKNGPQQIKWEAVRSRGQDPNFIIIIPIIGV